MRAVVNSFALPGMVLALQLAFATAPVHADVGEQEGADLFVPSFHVISGVTVQDWEGLAESEICRGCTFPDPAAVPLRMTVNGDDRDVTPYVGGGLELMTPELPIPGSLRFFVGGEFAAAFGTERRVAREGDPGLIQNPAPADAPNQPFDEDIATGQGSATIATMDDFIYGAHAGIAIPFSMFGRQLRIKPSFAWIRYEIDLEGQVNDAECFQPAFGLSQCNPLSLSTPNGFLRPIVMDAEESESFDGIGGGLDVEVDTGRFGPVGSSLFLGARLYSILGDRTVEFESPVLSFNDPAGVDQTRARFEYEVDPLMYRIGVGLRLQWLGFEE